MHHPLRERQVRGVQAADELELDAVGREVVEEPTLAEEHGYDTRVTELVAQGLSTRQIAGRLQVSAYTVQDPSEVDLRKVGHRVAGRSGRPTVLRPLRRTADDGSGSWLDERYIADGKSSGIARVGCGTW